jgi:deoxyribose-phosphate aldolase
MSQSQDPKDIVNGEFEHLETSGAAELDLVAKVDALLEKGDPATVAALCAACGVETADKRRGAAILKVLQILAPLLKELGLSAFLA